ncbi:putative C-3',4' desaturase CrtD [Leptospira ryugenii]|uniref:Putative C-3',4' desaturase CrtD n=2 Tax=Leptospira ryugenii TaxID=1917863 RepID=A0A2P2DVB8_9LEPT|nr:putative C-3',4' desaturase CrtD [Leptospira ryugenii]
MEEIWDAIVVGGGLGGLAFASRYAKEGNRVLVLEKGIHPGGCASSFDRAGFRFESGATTVVGWEEGLPLAQLERDLGIQFPRIPLSPSMVVLWKDKELIRYPEREKWQKEIARVFGKSKRMEWFWRFLFFLSDGLWSISGRYLHFPIANGKDIFRLLRTLRPKDILIFCASFLPFRWVLKIFGLEGKEEWISFLDEQLMITNQCKSKEAPLLTAAAGLCYPNLINTYIPGGILRLSETLVEYLEKNRGECHLKEEVIRIRKDGSESGQDLFQVVTKKSTYYSKVVVCNIPIWNVEPLLSEEIPARLHAIRRFEEGIYSAFTMGVVLRTSSLVPKSYHYQIHLSAPLPEGGGDSIFVSLSHPEDKLRSRDGVLVLSISTHVSDPETWRERGKDYQNHKQIWVDTILSQLAESLPWFRKEEIIALHSASPLSWQTWTGRKLGRVGGIPFSYFSNPFRFLSPNVLSVKGLYLCGDTVYPGQGIPAVVLGGSHLAQRLQKKEI